MNDEKNCETAPLDNSPRARAVRELGEERIRQQEDQAAIAFSSSEGLALRKVWESWRGPGARTRAKRQARFLSAFIVTGDVGTACKISHTERAKLPAWLRTPEFRAMFQFIKGDG